MSHFSVALELCYICSGETLWFLRPPAATKHDSRPYSRIQKPGFRTGGTQNEKYESRVTSSSPPHWLISLKGDGQWGGSS